MQRAVRRIRPVPAHELRPEVSPKTRAAEDIPPPEHSGYRQAQLRHAPFPGGTGIRQTASTDVEAVIFIPGRNCGDGFARCRRGRLGIHSSDGRRPGTEKEIGTGQALRTGKWRKTWPEQALRVRNEEIRQGGNGVPRNRTDRRRGPARQEPGTAAEGKRQSAQTGLRAPVQAGKPRRERKKANRHDRKPIRQLRTRKGEKQTGRKAVRFSLSRFVL